MTRLKEYVLSLYPPGEAAGACLGGLGRGFDGAPRYDVLIAPLPCADCGTVMTLIQREDHPEPVYYEVLPPVLNAASATVCFLPHDITRCRAAAGDRR